MFQTGLHFKCNQSSSEKKLPSDKRPTENNSSKISVKQTYTHGVLNFTVSLFCFCCYVIDPNVTVESPIVTTFTQRIDVELEWQHNSLGQEIRRVFIIPRKQRQPNLWIKPNRHVYHKLFSNKTSSYKWKKTEIKAVLSCQVTQRSRSNFSWKL